MAISKTTKIYIYIINCESILIILIRKAEKLVLLQIEEKYVQYNNIATYPKLNIL